MPKIVNETKSEDTTLVGVGNTILAKSEGKLTSINFLEKWLDTRSLLA